MNSLVLANYVRNKFMIAFMIIEYGVDNIMIVYFRLSHMPNIPHAQLSLLSQYAASVYRTSSTSGKRGKYFKNLWQNDRKRGLP